MNVLLATFTCMLATVAGRHYIFFTMVTAEQRWWWM